MKLLGACDLDMLCASNKKIWIKNTTKFVILIGMQDGSCLRIPNTDSPLCLNNYYPTEAIKKSSDLRRMIAVGKIILFNPKDERLKKQKGLLPPEKDKVVRVCAYDPVSMELNPKQMRELGNAFAEFANGGEEGYWGFPPSVVDKWDSLASSTFPASSNECAEIAASLLYGEADLLTEREKG